MITDYKIKPEDFTGLDVSSLPDQPSLSAAELKARFDSPAKVVLSGKINRFLDALSSPSGGASGAHLIGSAPVDGVDNPNGGKAATVYEQVCALQRNIMGVVNKDFPANSLDGSKITDGSITTEKFGQIDGSRIQSVLELPIAPGETLTTPCVVKLGADGVEIPKPKAFRGVKNYWADNQLESSDGILYNPLVYPMSGEFVLVSYYRCTSPGTLQLTVAIGKLDNNYLMPVQYIHTGSAVAAGTQTPVMLTNAGGDTWLAGFVDSSPKSTYIYAFRFDGTTYEHISKYEGLSGLGDEAGRFLALSGNKVLLKYFNGSTYGVVVKFTGTEFTAGTAFVLNSTASSFNLVRLSENRCLFQQAAGTVRSVSVNDTNLTLGPTYSYGKNGLLIAAVSENRAAYYFDGGGTMDCVLLDVSGSGVISPSGASVKLFSFHYLVQSAALPSGYAMFAYLVNNLGSGLKQMSAVCKAGGDGVKLVGTGSWPIMNIASTMADQSFPSVSNDTPYTIATSPYSGTYGSILKYGSIEFGSVLEPLEWIGMALSQSNGKVKVLTDSGIVKGFSGLKRGTVYSVGYNGRLCDIKNHPMSVKAGIAIDSETLWFTGCR